MKPELEDKIKKTINDFNCCPHCGSDYGYYRKIRGKYFHHDNTGFDHQEKMNTEMWDGATDTWISKWIYCMECDKKIIKAL